MEKKKLWNIFTIALNSIIKRKVLKITMIKSKYYCPICGHRLKNEFGTGDICSCCFMESEFDDRHSYNELEWGIQDYNNMFTQLSSKEILNIIPNYNQKKSLDEDVPRAQMWAYLRAIWIKSNCKFMTNTFERKRRKRKKNWSKKAAYEQLKNINVDAVSFIASVWGKDSTLYKEAVEIMKQSI